MAVSLISVQIYRDKFSSFIFRFSVKYVKQEDGFHPQHIFPSRHLQFSKCSCFAIDEVVGDYDAGKKITTLYAGEIFEEDCYGNIDTAADDDEDDDVNDDKNDENKDGGGFCH